MLALWRGPTAIGRALRLTFSGHTIRYALPVTAQSPSRAHTLTRCFHVSQVSRQVATSAVREDAPPYQGPVPKGPATKFQELLDRGLVNEAIIKPITEGMGHSTMTPVQMMTINETLKGIDVIAQAKTGTGKTLGFLIPVLEKILRDDPSLAVADRRHRTNAQDIRAIIISPTRELAEQIAVEARKLTTRNTGVIVQTAVGGTQKREALYKMRREGCHLLVATPGRLKDLLSDPSSGVNAPKLTAFVLDEADRLMDQGFWPEIQYIMSMLPPRSQVDRQTLMFSATIPEGVVSLVRETMKPDFRFVRTVQEGEQQTHERVPQKVVQVNGFENVMPTLLELCKREIEHIATQSGADPFKAIVYLGSTANVHLAAAIFRNLRGDDQGGQGYSTHPLSPTKIMEMHARLTQGQRTVASESFRRAPSAILFSSDVTARGMDFPNVTHVIQLGVPQTRDDYVHRIGRTARGNKTGQGWLLLTKPETTEAAQRLRGLPIKADASLKAASIDMTKPSQVPASVSAMLTQVGEATKRVSRAEKVKAYLALLGSYAFIGARDLVPQLNTLVRFGWAEADPIKISQSLASRLHLSNVPGIEIGYEAVGDEGQDGYGTKGSFSFGGRGRAGDFRGASGGDSSHFGGGFGGGGFGGGYDRQGSRPPRDGSRSGGYGGRGGSGGGGGYGGGYGGRRGGSGGFSDRGRSSREGGSRGSFSRFG